MRIFDDNDKALNDVICGVLAVNPDKYTRLETEYGYGIYRNDMQDDTVRVILNGGGGIGPMWSECAVDGLADAIVHGEFDCAPNAYTIYEMAKTIDCGRGVIILTNNYMGDYLNNDMAKELLAYDGISSEICLIHDDIASAIGKDKNDRGGLTGILQVAKAVYKAASQGKSLDEVKKTAENVNDNTFSITALCDDDGRLSFGAGFSGEAPRATGTFVSASMYVKNAIDMILEDIGEKPDKVFLSISRMRNTCFAEGMVILNASINYLDGQGIEVTGSSVGSYFDVFETGGCIFTLVTEGDAETVSGYDFTV